MTERLRQLADAMPIIIWTSKPDGNLDYYNDRWYEYTGTTLEETRDSGWRIVVHPDDFERCVNRWMQSVRSGDPYEIEYRFKRHDGVYRWFLGRALPVRDRQGQIVWWAGTGTDIDDQRRLLAERDELLLREHAAREHAERANRFKDQFLAVLSHELRTPMTTIIGWSSMLDDERIDPSAQRHGIRMIRNSAAIQAQIIDDLLDAMKMLTGKLLLSLAPVDVVVTVRDGVAAMVPAAAERDITVGVHGDAEAMVLGDAVRLTEVVVKLLSNAVKFSARGGRIEVGVATAGHAVDITVRDFGMGIGRDFLPRIFERFTQQDGSTTRTYGGLGLGLAIVHDLVELHHGTVEAMSDGEGHGATFTVKLPALEC